MDVAVTEPGQPARRLVGDAIAIINEHHPARGPRHQLADQELEPAIRQVDGEERVTGPVLTVFADIDKGDFAAVAEPAPHGRDVDLGDIRHRGASKGGKGGSMAPRAPPSRRLLHHRIASFETAPSS